MRKFVAAVVLLLAAASTIAAAQDDSKNEVAVSVAHMFISDQGVPNTNFFDNTVHFGKGWSFEGNYARSLWTFPWGRLSAEVPVVFNPDEDLNYGLNQVPRQYSSIFITPAAHVTFLQNLPFSPWVSFGGGLAHYVASKDLLFSGQNTGHRVNTSGAIEAGLGLDVKIPKVSSFRFRFEARDFWTGEPPINVDTGHSRLHNYFLGGGAVFRF
jgi:opacity protein-like surface antigen